MNRRIFLQVTAPTLIIGLLLCGVCLVSTWYINRMQTNLTHILSEHIASLRAAQQLEIDLRLLRFHSFLYLIDPYPELLQNIREDHQHFEESLAEASRLSAHIPEEQGYIRDIHSGYKAYHDEFRRLQSEARDRPRRDFRHLAVANPVRHIVDPCHALVQINDKRMAHTFRESERISRLLRLAMLLLGLGGPVGGLIIGYGIARGLSRSIYQLSVRVQDMAQRLDQDVASVSIAADGDIASLDKQLQEVVHRVEEVAERLHQHQLEIVRAEQLSAVGQLAASVAHEIRNPLTSVKLLVEAALREPQRKALNHDDLEVIHGEIARLEGTVQSFLGFARPTTPQRSPSDMREVVQQAIEIIRARARQQNVEVIIRSRNEPAIADIDRGQFCTVLVNLFLNALDAMPQGGCLEIELHVPIGSGIRLRISDTGSGVAPEISNRLFTPFATTKATGTGLGLSISRRIVEEHGGRITVENRPAGGAMFTIILPVISFEKSHAYLVSHR